MSNTKSKNERLFWSLSDARAHAAKLAAALDKFCVRSYADRIHYRQMVARQASLTQRIEIEAFLAQCNAAVNPSNFVSHEAFLAEVCMMWYKLREDWCGDYYRPRDETLCDDTCATEHRTVISVCPLLSMYGCTRHGTLHACGGRRGQRQCTLRITTSEWTQVCMFSGAEVDQVLAQVASLAESYEPGGLAGRAAFNSFAARKQHAEVVGTFDSSGSHTEAQARLWRQQIASGQLVSLPDSTRTADGAARQMTSDERHSFRFDRRVLELSEEAQRKMHAVIGDVIDHILFSDETRDLVNIQLLSDAKRKARRLLFDYHTRCRTAKSAPSLITAACIYKTPLHHYEPLPLVQRDDLRRNRMIRHCARFWELCHRSPFVKEQREQAAQLRGAKRSALRQTACTLVQFVVATLYMYREGYAVAPRAVIPGSFVLRGESRVFVPCELRTNVELPREENLDSFGPQSTAVMRAHVSCSDIPDAVGAGDAGLRGGGSSSNSRRVGQEIVDDLYKQNNTFSTRKSRHKKKQTTANSGSRLVTLRASLSSAAVSSRERDVLPPHLHTQIYGEPGYYEKADVSTGTQFIRACVRSLNDDQLDFESRWLMDI